VAVSFIERGRAIINFYVRYVGQQKRVVPIDMGEKEFSPPYVLRIFRQFGFSDEEIEDMLK
jgi:hypothetical protein